MKKEQNDAEWYLKDPRTRKWMAQCAACLKWGYRADSPGRFFGRSQLEKHLGELRVNAQGICDQCQAASSR